MQNTATKIYKSRQNSQESQKIYIKLENSTTVKKIQDLKRNFETI